MDDQIIQNPFIDVSNSLLSWKIPNKEFWMPP